LGDSTASGERCLVGVRRSGERASLAGLLRTLTPCTDSSSDHMDDSSSDHSGRYTARVAAFSVIETNTACGSAELQWKPVDGRVGRGFDSRTTDSPFALEVGNEVQHPDRRVS
jgi:hypothetical protein